MLSLFLIYRPEEFIEVRTIPNLIEMLSKNISKFGVFIPFFCIAIKHIPQEMREKFQELLFKFSKEKGVKDNDSTVFINYDFFGRIFALFKQSVQNYSSPKAAFLKSLQEISSFAQLSSIYLSCFNEDLVKNESAVHEFATEANEKENCPRIQKASVICFLYPNSLKTAKFPALQLTKMFHFINLSPRISEKQRMEHLIRVNRSQFQAVFSREQLDSITKSYFISSCDVPSYFRKLVARSSFPLPDPDAPKVSNDEKEKDPCIFNIIDIKKYAIQLPETFPNVYKYSFMVHIEADDTYALFKELYEVDETNCYNATFVFLDIRENCVFAKKKDEFLILVGAQVVDNKLEISDIQRERNESLISNVLSGEFGECSMFLGRVIIHVRNVCLVAKYSYLSSPFSFVFHSSTCVTIIVDFRQQLNLEFARHKSLFLKQKELVDTWVNGGISLVDFLFCVNTLAFRSASDLNAYSIYPRVVANMKNSDFSGEILRDLATPIQLCFNKEQRLKKVLKNFNLQKFHHAESNLSNSTLVFALNYRLLPFCRSLWEINDGWDKENRSFKQVVLHLVFGTTCPIHFLSASHSLRHSKASMSREEHGWETASLFLSRSSMRR